MGWFNHQPVILVSKRNTHLQKKPSQRLMWMREPRPMCEGVRTRESEGTLNFCWGEVCWRDIYCINIYIYIYIYIFFFSFTYTYTYTYAYAYTYHIRQWWGRGFLETLGFRYHRNVMMTLWIHVFIFISNNCNVCKAQGNNQHKKTFSKQHSLAGQMEPLVMVGAGTDQLEFTLWNST